MPNWSTLIYDEIIWHKIQVVRYERAALAQIALKWDEMADMLEPSLSVQPHIRSIQAAAHHYAAKDMKRILDDYLQYTGNEINKEMLNAYNLMVSDCYLSMKTAEPLAFDLIPWAHIPEETMMGIENLKVLGHNLSDFKNTVEAKQLAAIRGEMQKGLIAGEGVEELARRLTKTLKYSKISAMAVARTAINGAANRGLDKVYKANADLISKVQYDATLDTRTCEICAGYDGQEYSVNGSRPHTPVHINCRCVYLPVMKSAKELGLGPVEIPKGMRQSMDGEVPDTVKYPDWFLRQSDERQKNILGRKKYLAWKAGEYTPKWESLGRGCTEYLMFELYSHDKELCQCGT